MAHVLLAHLKKFVNQPDVQALPNSDNIFLKDIFALSDATCDILDKISDSVSSLWQGKKPPIEVSDLLEKNDFPVQAAKIELGIWKEAYIKTKKGRIQI